MAQKGLGAGLGALIKDDLFEDSAQESTLPTMKIEPRADQPRRMFDEDALFELAESLKEHGMIQPITVRPMEGGYYQIIAGERRWRAARLAGLTQVPVRIMDVGDKETAEIALIENLQREDLNPVEEALGYKALMENYGLTQEKAAQRVGKSRPVIANALRLLNLPEEVLEMVEDGSLSLSHARALLEAKEPMNCILAAHRTVEMSLSVRETTNLVKRLNNGFTEKKETDRRSADGVDYYAQVEKDLTQRTGRRVKISAGAKKGKFEIEYYGKEDFEVLYQALLQLRPKAGGED